MDDNLSYINVQIYNNRSNKKHSSPENDLALKVCKITLYSSTELHGIRGEWLTIDTCITVQSHSMPIASSEVDHIENSTNELEVNL